MIGEGAGPGFGGGERPVGPVAPVAPFPGGEGVKGKNEPKIVPRYEFVIVFIWREPVGPEPTAVAVSGAPPAPDAKK